MKAKLINNQLDYFKQPDFILGDASTYAKEHGYKDITYQTGDNGIYETETNIIVETPEYIMTNEEIRQRRCEQYKLYSDSYYMAYQKYTAFGETDKAEQARTQWLEEINKIDNENPYY